MSLPNFPLSQLVSVIRARVADCEGMTVDDGLACLATGTGCARVYLVDLTRVSPESLRHVIGEPLPAEPEPVAFVDDGEPLEFLG